MTVLERADPPVLGFRDALARLAAHQKTSKGAPAYSRFINRRLGRYAAAAAYTQGLTPNQVTVLSAGATFSGIAAVALVHPSPLQSAAVSLALVTGYALDSADGQLARLRGGGSLSGEWLDHVFDAAKAACLHAAVLVSLYRFTSVAPGLLTIPLAQMCISTTWFFAVVLTDQLRRSRSGGRPLPGTAAPASLLRSLLALPTDYGVTCLMFLLLAQTELFLGAYSLLAAGGAAIFAASLVSWYRELAAPAPAAGA